MYSRTFINVLTLILTIVIFSIVNFFMTNSIESNIEVNISEAKDVTQNTEEINQTKEYEEKILQKKETIPEEITWKIEIPKISLSAPIADGTDANILNEYVGHFKETQNLEGNVGLAAHNRGYPVNYFARLKDVKEGDEIIYIFGENRKVYEVVKNIEISDIDWSYLENTEENKITLITCIENKPAYRRCVQAIEKD